MNAVSSRSIVQLIPAVTTSDGAGVKLMRSLGSQAQARLDPFLLLDEFGSDHANDYIAGFPAHPHRGFETVTYMLEGHMLHKDNMGNQGHLRDGDVQWMTAAHGIIHSEMPQQQAGRMHGFQLWINLPASEKMKPASYRDIPANKIPVATLANGAQVKVIAGALQQEAKQAVTGPVQGLSTEVLYFDVQLPANAQFQQPLQVDHHALIYAYAGSVQIDQQAVPAHAAAILGEGTSLTVTANEDARFLVLAGKPLNEPVVQYGPFVMNSVEEIDQAIRDYQSGKLVARKAHALQE